jgi:hypothetical protein
MGDYSLDYMIGDSENGLNQQRSDGHVTTIASARSVTQVKTQAENHDVLLKWMPPLQGHKLMGYYVYRNGSLMNSVVTTEPHWTDTNVPSGSHSYSIVPLYYDGTLGAASIPARICFTTCGTSMLFDGVDDKVVVFDDPSLELGSTLTLEAWIKQDLTDNQDPRIISKGKQGEGYELLLTQLGKGKSLEFRMPFATLKSARELLPNQWYHVAAMYDGKLMKLFIDGKKDCERILSGPSKNSRLPLVIGKNSAANANYFQGLIDEVRIWNKDRTEAQIYETFSAKVDPNSDGLVGYWTMSEGCAGVTCDISKEANNGYLSGSCWSPATFPYVEDVSNQSNPGLIIPVMNLKPEVQMPQFYNLEFKINPKMLKFEGIITENTQLKLYTLKTQYLADGTIKIKAFRNSHQENAGDVLLYVNVKSLLPEVRTTLKFNKCLADGTLLRIGSGEVVATAVPETYKSDVAENSTKSALGQVYPNPAQDHLNIPIGEINGTATLKILNITGQVVYNQTLEESHSNTTRKIDLLGFSKGFYLINLQNNGQTFVKKVAVN